MNILSIVNDSFDDIAKQALLILQKGGIIAYPTESFYALGVLATDEAAIKRLFHLKKRPSDKPLPLIVGNQEILLSVVKDIPDQALSLIRRYWPGPLTLIFEAATEVPAILTGGSGKVAVRIPGESPALHLVRSLNLPVTATSANPSSLTPAQCTDSVGDYFGDEIDLIIDGGNTPGGKPSTIVDVTVTPPKVLRQGSVT